MDDSDTQFAVKKFMRTLAKPIAVILVFIGLVLFLMKAISGINVR